MEQIGLYRIPALPANYTLFFLDENTGYVSGDYGTILKTPVGGLGLNENDKPGKHLKIYPNPVKNIFTVDLTSMIGETIISIVNINGRLLKELRIKNYKTQIDIGDLPAGVYFIRLKNNETVEVGKIIKR